jgi:predicted nucleotidyltransferase
MSQRNIVKPAVNEARRLQVDVIARHELMHVAHFYGITPVFVGLFGSRAKGYHGPESDFDLYVPYVGKLGQYVRALDLDTRQVEGEPILPPQITIEVPGANNKTLSIQLNFMSLDHYIQELGRNNVDFRIALDNILLTYCDSSFTNLLHELAAVNVDLENIKNKALGRASKTAAMLRKVEGAQIKGPKIKPSEITDGIYRLLLAAGAVTGLAMPYLFCNYTPNFHSLRQNYLTNVEMDEQSNQTMMGIWMDIKSGAWKDTYEKWGPQVVELIDKLIPIIKAMPVTKAPPGFRETGIETQFAIASKINKAYQELVLKAHASRSLL